MTACEKYIKKIAEKLPEQCCVKDLIKAGLYASPQAARVARLAHSFPDYFKMGKRIVIPKECVIEWLNKSKNGGEYEYSLPPDRSETASKITKLSPPNWMETCC
jgi:hypothetical protein